MERIFAWSDGMILVDTREPLSNGGDAQSASTAIIIPGERIGHIRLGMSESQVEGVLGTPSRRTEFEGTTVEHEMQMIAFLNEHLGRNDTIEDFPPQPPCVFVDFEEQGLSVRLVHDYALSIFALRDKEPEYEIGQLSRFFTSSEFPEAFQEVLTKSDVQMRYGEPTQVIEGSSASPPNDTLCYGSGISFVVTREPERLSRVIVTPAREIDA